MSRKRQAADDPERLARRAAGGDLAAARRLVYVLEERTDSSHVLVPRKAVEVTVETLLAALEALKECQIDYDHMLESIRIARDALVDPAGDWEVRHLVWTTERRCRFCGMSIYDLRLAEDPTSTVPDWATWGGDFGCEGSPNTNEDGVGSHEPA